MANWRRLLKTPDIEALRAVADGQAKLEACPLCKDKPDEYAVLEKDDEESEFRGHLQGTGYLKRCPASGAVYFQEHSYEYLAGGSEDEYRFERVTPERARQIVDEWAAELAASPGDKPKA
jgi:hypothetical protein